MFGNLGLPELLIVLVIILLLFGAKKLPEVGAGLGKGIRSFRDAMKGEDTDKPSGQGGGENKGGSH